MKWWPPPRPPFMKSFFSLDQSARMLWFSRQKCAYFMIFATKERVCCDFWDKSAYFVIFATKMRVCCDFHDNNCVFGISGSNSCISQVLVPTLAQFIGSCQQKTVNKGLFRFWEKNKVFWIPSDPRQTPVCEFYSQISVFFLLMASLSNDFCCCWYSAVFPQKWTGSGTSYVFWLIWHAQRVPKRCPKRQKLKLYEGRSAKVCINTEVTVRFDVCMPTWSDLANIACQKDAQKMPKSLNCKKAEVCIDKEVTVRVWGLHS